MPLKLKVDESGHVVVNDGKPVYVDEKGTEIIFDANHAQDKITQLNGEAKNHRLAKETAETKLKLFEGIEPDAARDALEKMDSINKKKLVDAGEVDRVKKEITEAIEAKYKPTLDENSRLLDQLNNEIVGGAFSRSKFISEKVAVPAPMLRATYGKNFKVEEGKLVPYDNAGNKMMSHIKMGETPDFDEALEQLINSDPYKDDILKGRGNSGSGASGGGVGNNGTGGKQIPRSQWDSMDHVARERAMVDKVQIVD